MLREQQSITFQYHISSLWSCNGISDRYKILKHLHSTLALTNLSHYHTATHTAWRAAATAAAAFDWPSALSYCAQAKDSAALFYEHASELADLTELTECLNFSPTGLLLILSTPICSLTKVDRKRDRIKVEFACVDSSSFSSR